MTVNQVTDFAETAGRVWLKGNPRADFGLSSKKRKTRPHPCMIMFGLSLWPPCGFAWVFWLWQGLCSPSSICCAAIDPEKPQKDYAFFSPPRARRTRNDFFVSLRVTSWMKKRSK